MTKAELVTENEKLKHDKQLLRDENGSLNALLAAIRAILNS